MLFKLFVIDQLLAADAICERLPNMPGLLACAPLDFSENF